MPATEQTWRNTKLLHKIFAVSGVVMLATTIWVLAKDHARPWKPYQRTASQVEITLTDWRKLQYETNEAEAEKTKLEDRLGAVRREAVAGDLIDEFIAQVEAGKVSEEYVGRAKATKTAAEELAAVAGQEAAEAKRDRVIAEMRDIVASLRVVEETRLGNLKFARADRDAAVATLGLMVRDNKIEEQPEQQALVDQRLAKVDELQILYDEAKTQRTDLQAIIKRVTTAEDDAQDALAKNQAGLKQLESTEAGKRSTYIVWKGSIPLPGKRWLELPILDAFNSPRKIDNHWSDGLTIDYNFSKVRRFDRCTTCHQSIQKTNPGSAVDPAYVHDNLIDFVLLPPESKDGSDGEGDATPDDLLMHHYGLRLAAEGLLAVNDVTVQFVKPESLASRATSIGENDAASAPGADIRQQLLSGGQGQATVGAGLKLGDVIAQIDGDPVRDARKVMFRLLDAADANQTLVLTIRRGLPHPYTSHPRLDLFVGSLSPHKLADFACTVCHDGQGSATAFEWASHSPNTKLQSEEWSRNLGWFDNPHWIYPMYPDRFAEAACLKCHHNVTELEPSERFPDPPAPKVVHGYNLIRKFGCYGCHEITGYDGARRIGPDMRLEPNYFAASLQLQADAGYESLPDEVKGWVVELAEHPERDAVRHRLYEALLADAKAEPPVLSKTTHAALVPLLKDVENAGTLRRPGPSLRFVKQKLDAEFMFDWIQEPKRFRPSTRMPQFFRQWSHFPNGHDADAAAFEPVEILGIVTYLRQGSKDFEYLEPPAGVAEASAERGKVLFEERGCLACHNHKDFPNTATYRSKDEIVQGPDLSGVGTKFNAERNPDGAKWLYSWIKQPSRYHARTLMPDLFLDPIEQAPPAPPAADDPAAADAAPADEPPAAEPIVTDPAADIVAYLLESSVVDWQPTEGTLASAADVDVATLDRLVFENLRDDAFAEAAATVYAKEGIPARLRQELKGAEIELLTDTEGAVVEGNLTTEAKLRFLGRKSFAKYGCYGCHDVPGFEDAKPIGTALADWGRKESSKLAFEHITHYLEGHGHGGQGAHNDDGRDDGETEEMRDYYHLQIEGHHREGFIYQKLAEPRSYDYHRTENKKYYERLRMPKFPFTAQEREAVITFVLGLVADPPSAKYIYKPDARQKAITEGRQVLDKYNCAGCHMLEPERWNIAHAADAFGEQPASKGYPFLTTHFTTDQLEASRASDPSGLMHSTIKGMPALEDLPSGVRPLIYDDFGDPIEDAAEYSPSKLEFPFDLWLPTTIGGNTFDVGVLPLNVRTPQIEKKYSTRGGFLAKYLLQPVVQREKQVNPAAKGTEAWGWLPPPLVGEGAKVQTSWLHDFLLNPYPIRPAVVLRMPRFNMSPDEATKLVNYFAAIENVDYPYDSSPRQQENYLSSLEAAYQQATGGAGTRLGDAMKVVTNNNYCVKCHLIGDFEPKGADRAKAPNLAVVYNRLRPGYLRNWIANPKTVLPYTSMPVNVPYNADVTEFRPAPDQPVLYHGGSTETVDALVDLLLNYDKYAKQRSSVAELITGEAPAAVVPSPIARPAEPAPTPVPAPAASAKPLPDSLKNLPAASGWGDLKVRFVYDGTAPSPAPINVTKDQEFCGKFGLVDESVVVNAENGGIKNVIATLSRGNDKSPIPIHESYLEHVRDQVYLDNNKCRFEPRVTLLWTPQTLLLKNSDSVGHNTKIDTFSNQPINDIVPAGTAVSKEFPQAERRAAPVACSIHPWMKAWLVIQDNPYFAVSDKDGNLEIKNLPAGDWSIQFWQEAAGYVANVKVNGKTTEWKRGVVDVKIENGKAADLGVVEFAPSP
ncbi:MAG: hypothetical protein O3C40_16245 [Planctomycetota bacterium]|nr:hypothetical protein [Planctomycetota bacterium]